MKKVQHEAKFSLKIIHKYLLLNFDLVSDLEIKFFKVVEREISRFTLISSNKTPQVRLARSSKFAHSCIELSNVIDALFS